jgi:hypothetical protein
VTYGERLPIRSPGRDGSDSDALPAPTQPWPETLPSDLQSVPASAAEPASEAATVEPRQPASSPHAEP